MKFVVFGPNFEATDRLLDDIKELENVIYISNPIKNNSKLISRIMNSHVTRFPKIPFKKIWIHFFKEYGIKKDDQVCFLYLEVKWIAIMKETGFVNNLKQKYINSKHIIYLTDVHKARRLNYKFLKETYDDFYIFDKNIAKELCINYYPLFYSKRQNVVQTENKKSDIAFVGQAKDRYTEIIKIYEKLTSNGLKCNFYLIGVHEEKQKYKESITYGSFISSDEAFEYTNNSKCILEIQVGDCNSFSNRVMEAVATNKKILTNNIHLKNFKYYDEKYIQIYTDVNSIDFSFFAKNDEIQYDYNNDFSPIYFLDFIKHQYFNTVNQ